MATAPVDGYGHGTHVAGLVAGSGALSNGQYAGVAPNARLIGLRVLDDSGNGSTSDVIAAIEFATANKSALGIDIINLSLGHPMFEAGRDRPAGAGGRSRVARRHHRRRLGRQRRREPDHRPGRLRRHLVAGQRAVGVHRRLREDAGHGRLPTDDLIANYSSRGPTWIDGFAKPDFAAPGQNLVAPAAPGSYLATTYPSLLVTDNYGSKTLHRR